MWADTLLEAERLHLLALIAWAAASVLAGTTLLAWLRWRSDRHSTLLDGFALQTAVWGALELTVALVSYRSLAPRDLAGATRLDRLIWFNAGLSAGCVFGGLALIAVAWTLGRRLRVVGAGAGIAVQGCALTVLELLLASQISR